MRLSRLKISQGELPGHSVLPLLRAIRLSVDVGGEALLGVGFRIASAQPDKRVMAIIRPKGIIDAPTRKK